MKSDYIEKVISYIKSKRGKSEVEAELYDHIKLYNDFYEEIGYDEENALVKAEDRMGSADVTGEQFAQLKNSKSIRDIILIICGVALVLFCDSVSVIIYNLEEITYTSFTVTAVTFLLSLIYLYFAFKRLNIFSVICSVFSVILTSNIYELSGYEFTKLVSFNPIMFIYDLFFGRSMGDALFGIGYGDMLYFPIINDVNIAVSALFFLLLLIAVILKIRIRKLKNSTKDLTVKKVIRVAIFLYTALICATFAFNAAAVNKQPELYENQRETLMKCDELFTKNIGDFSDDDFQKISDSVNSDSVNNDVELRKYNYCNSDLTYENFKSFTLYPNLTDVNGKPVRLCSDGELAEAKRLAESKDFSIDKLSCPFALHYYSNEEETQLHIIFAAKEYSDYDEEWTDYIVLDVKDGKYSVDYSVFESLLDDKYSVNLSEKQLDSLDLAIRKYAARPINENIGDRRDMYVFDDLDYTSAYRENGGLTLYEINKKFSKLSIRSEVEFLDINKVDDKYRADVILTYDVYTVNDSRLFDFDYVRAPFSYTFTLNGDSAIIKEEWYPKSKDELEPVLRYRFSPVAYNRYQNYESGVSPVYDIQREAGYTLFGSIVSVDKDGTVVYATDGINIDDDAEYEKTAFK